MTTELESVLHHYTSIENMKSIIESKSLHFTHYEFTNDDTEIKFGESYYRRLFVQAMHELQTYSLLAKSNLTAEAIVFRDIDSNFQNIFNVSKKDFEPYILSLCTLTKENNQHDDGLLSMWKSYGNMGCALEFDQEKLISQLNSEEKNIFLKLPGSKMVYINTLTNKEQESEIYNLLKNLAAVMNKESSENHTCFQNIPIQEEIKTCFKFIEIVLETTDPSKHEKMNKAYINCISSIYFSLNYIKHFGFHEEKEFRFCFLYPKQQSLKTEPSLKFKPRNGMLVPYLDIKNKDIINCIKRIIIAPGLNQDLNAKSVQMFLDSQKDLPHEITVIKSTIPYVPS
jgi:Protein of unknown function (DUF2971)